LLPGTHTVSGDPARLPGIAPPQGDADRPRSLLPPRPSEASVPALAFACGDDEVFDSETGGRVAAGREEEEARRADSCAVNFSPRLIYSALIWFSNRCAVSVPGPRRHESSDACSRAHLAVGAWARGSKGGQEKKWAVKKSALG
jgi:hypothetical protein